ncbi:MAG: radical SAM protein [Clostridia bacterium]|nr:radical SAM protein [Clostridia bacterium]
MTITYEFGDALYVNMTNRCSNDCTFCVRNNHDDVNGEDNLWLDREPTIEEIKEDFEKRDLSKYSCVVFCGYGEPLMRFDDCIEIAKWIKEKCPFLPVRINTNGQANMIEGRDVTPLLSGVIDTVSISLNASNAKRYDEICQSVFGEAAFEGIQEFARLAKRFVPKVVFSIVDHDISKEEIEACRDIAKNCGVDFRIREYIE